MEASYYGCDRPEVRELVPSFVMRILDVGCGWGRVGAALKAAVPGREVTGVELVADVAQVARQYLDRVIVGDIEEVVDDLPRRYFDCVILADVLEHLRDPWRTVRRLSEALRPGAVFVASVPNVAHWSVVRALVEGDWQYEDEGLLDRTHLRFFTKKTATELFEQAGWRVLGVRALKKQEGGSLPPALIEELERVGCRARRLLEEAYDYQYLVWGCYTANVACPVTDKLVSIVVPCWNGVGYTRSCVESILADTEVRFELILVDNGSTDGTPQYTADVVSRYPMVGTVRNEQNLGFGLACNQGMRVARGDYLVILNNDTLVTEGWLARVLDHAESDPEVGIVAPRSNWVAGPQLVENVSYGEDLTRLPAFAQRWRASHFGRRRYVDRVVGLCMLVKRRLVEKIGGFDPRFGLGNFEDDDFCLRARMAGFRICIADDVFVHHFGHRAFADNGVDYGALMRRNWERFRSKWGIFAPEPGAYDLSALASRSDSVELYTPLDPEEALRPRGDPLRLWKEDSFSYLVFPDWDDPASRWPVILRTFCRAFTPADRVCLVLRVDPAGATSVRSVLNAVTMELGRAGLDPACIPDVVLCDDRLDWEEVKRVFRAAEAYIPSGEVEQGLHTYQAALYGLAQPRGITPDGLRALVPRHYLASV